MWPTASCPRPDRRSARKRAWGRPLGLAAGLTLAFAPAARAVDAPASTAPAGSAPAAAPPRFAERVAALSEPDRHFFSDNSVSNETSYLHVAEALEAKVAPGGAYIGVGPEQNFAYLALTRPQIAFIVDIRRDNLLLHLLYRALFEAATSRSHFLALLVGRPYDAATEPGADAGLAAVLAHAERLPATEDSYRAAHDDALRLIAERTGVPLSADDLKSLEKTHRAFFKGQLDLRFELEEKNRRVYPRLRDLLGAADAAGRQRGFLATDAAFRFVQTMEREGRVIPVVGDFGGDHALAGVAAAVRDMGLTVSAFYVSNVEQYLFQDDIFKAWARNIAALPTDERSLFIRCYLDQGRRHPNERKGHRTATILQRVVDFNTRQASKKPYRSWWDVSTHQVVE